MNDSIRFDSTGEQRSDVPAAANPDSDGIQIGVVTAKELPKLLGVEKVEANVSIVPIGRLATALQKFDALYAYVWGEDLLNLGRILRLPHAIRWLHVANAGVELLAPAAEHNKDLLVTNSRGIFSEPIGEFVVAAILAHVKLFQQSARLQRERRWVRRSTSGMRGRRVLVFGAGSIGSSVARLLTAFGCDISLVGQRRRIDNEFGLIYGPDQVDALLGNTQHVVICAPETPETKEFFDFARLKQLPSEGAQLINVGRSSIAPVADLLRALDDGYVSEAVLDVFDEEPLPTDSVLWDHPKVVISPHISGETHRWRKDADDLFLRNAQKWLHGEALENVIDLRTGKAVA